jgi:SAM-dependent methyltransferase
VLPTTSTWSEEAADLGFSSFAERIQRLREEIGRRDPDGVDFALRVGIAHALFLYHDRLRSEEQPFDRAAFARRLDSAYGEVACRAHVVRAVGANAAAVTAVYEDYVADLYSRCWAKYDDRAFMETVDFFEERFRLNGISLDLTGQECLDAGCGSGRYTLAMVKCGARRAIGVDLSARAIADARARADRLQEFGSKVEFVQGSVIDLPGNWSQRFDFVCSNGVVHHTPDPVKGIDEIFRVLKPGGRAFIMVYGKGGLFWALVDFIREILTPVPVDFAEAWLELSGVPVGKIFFCLDHWYTVYQERLDRSELEARLAGAGFTDIQYLPHARIYDSSERLHRYAEEADLIGSPDPRYLVTRPA